MTHPIIEQLKSLDHSKSKTVILYRGTATQFINTVRLLSESENIIDFEEGKKQFLRNEEWKKNLATIKDM